MERLSPSIFIGKKLEGTRVDPQPDPYYGRGLKKSWSRKKTECAVVERQTPVGVGIRKDIFRPTKSHGYTPEGSDLNEREPPSPGHAMGDKRRPRPSESSCLKKPPKEYSMPRGGANDNRH